MFEMKPDPDATPILDEGSFLDVKFALDAKPPVDAKSALDVKPALNVNSPLNAKPVLDVKPVFDVKPPIDAEPPNSGTTAAQAFAEWVKKNGRRLQMRRAYLSAVGDAKSPLHISVGHPWPGTPHPLTPTGSALLTSPSNHSGAPARSCAEGMDAWRGRRRVHPTDIFKVELLTLQYLYQGTTW